LWGASAVNNDALWLRCRDLTILSKSIDFDFLQERL
jgi:hypothetical protein